MAIWALVSEQILHGYSFAGVLVLLIEDAEVGVIAEGIVVADNLALER